VNLQGIELEFSAIMMGFSVHTHAHIKQKEKEKVDDIYCGMFCGWQKGPKAKIRKSDCV